jgi:ADP-ribosylglycohydrolase
MTIPNDYGERVYAGVLGKIIGVYLGRPFEGATYESILENLGEIEYYVNDRMANTNLPRDKHPPLVVTDDDITGTFTFLRALSDYGNSLDLTPAQIGQSWLNYIIEERTILWWGGFGNSTEHTAFIRLKNGIQAPASGSIEMNSAVVAEQIGAQIFIDGWGMVSPGNPERAADLAGRAASVSHDREAKYGAQVLAAMEAQAFIESDINKLLDVGVSVIPKDSTIYRMISDIRGYHAAEPDWHKGRAKMAELYNYENYGGNCHMVPFWGCFTVTAISTSPCWLSTLPAGIPTATPATWDACWASRTAWLRLITAKTGAALLRIVCICRPPMVDVRLPMRSLKPSISSTWAGPWPMKNRSNPRMVPGSILSIPVACRVFEQVKKRRH